MPKWDNQGWWPHGMTKMEWARSPVGYIAKTYMSKASQGSWDGFSTKGARWWGHSGLRLVDKLVLRRVMAPGWVRKIWHAMDDVGAAVRRLPFGWWLIGGWEFRTPWEMVGIQAEGVRVRWVGWDSSGYELSPVVTL
jgi:hypothetical protein